MGEDIKNRLFTSKKIESQSMEITFYIGSLAAILTTAAFLPQAIKVYQTKHTKDLSLAMLIMLFAGLILWTTYGLILKSLPIIAANSITLFIDFYLICAKIRYK